MDRTGWTESSSIGSYVVVVRDGHPLRQEVVLLTGQGCRLTLLGAGCNAALWFMSEEIVVTTAAEYRSQTVKDLGKLAKTLGLPGWSSMRKDDLIRALVRAARAKAKAKSSSKATAAKARVRSKTSRPLSRASKRTRAKATAANQPKVKVRPAARRRLRHANEQRKQRKDLSTPMANGRANGAGGSGRRHSKDRIVLLVRDPFWIQACWEVSRQGMERARAAMAEYWHTAKPTLRVYEVEQQATTSTAEWVARDIEVHGGVNNWYTHCLISIIRT